MACKPWRVDTWTTPCGEYLGSYFFGNKVEADNWVYDYNIINESYGIHGGFPYYDMAAGEEWERDQLRKEIEKIEEERYA